MRAKKLSVSEAAEAADHAADMLNRAETHCGAVDGFETVAEYRRAIRRCPGHFTMPQREAAQRIMLNAYMRAIGRC